MAAMAGKGERMKRKERSGRSRVGRASSSQDAIDVRLYVAGVAKALGVLHAFYDQRAPLSLTEIADRTSIGRSAAQRFVYTLKVLGYLKQDACTKRYRLTPKVVDFAHAYLRNDGLVEKSLPYLLEASKRTDETVNLTRLDGHQVVFLSRFPSRNIISADLVVGSRLPAFCTSPGRSMLAHVSESQAIEILTAAPRLPRTPYTITDLDEILGRLERIRKRGYEVAVEESFRGDLSVAAPVFSHEGKVVAAVNIAVPTPRWTERGMVRDLAPVVVETARAISGALDDLLVD